MKTTPYPKTYATIVGFWPPLPASRPYYDAQTWISARVDATGAMRSVKAIWRSGGKPGAMVKPGARIKIYQRPGVAHENYRLVGD